MGKARFFLFFLLCGITAAFAQAFLDPNSRIPMVGASGAISGVIAAYLLLYPRANIRVFYWFLIFLAPLLTRLLNFGALGIRTTIALPESMRAAGGVAIAAHLGGFGAGVILTRFSKKKS